MYYSQASGTVFGGKKEYFYLDITQTETFITQQNFWNFVIYWYDSYLLIIPQTETFLTQQNFWNFVIYSTITLKIPKSCLLPNIYVLFQELFHFPISPVLTLSFIAALFVVLLIILDGFKSWTHLEPISLSCQCQIYFSSMHLFP